MGSTGSIGRNTLKVIKHLRAKFRVLGLSANSDIDTLYQQIKEFNPEYVCVRDKVSAAQLRGSCRSKPTKVLSGEEGIQELICNKHLDRIVLAISGSAALIPLFMAIENRKDVALANKEALVMAGSLIMSRSREKGVSIIPIDSEQSAIWQCLHSEDKAKVKTVYLTASGGPFIKRNKDDLRDVSLEEVLRHPRWKMGKKVTIDSATLMNKGLEIIETMFLFAMPIDKIKVVIHPEAIIHSMVEFIDGVVLAQLSVTDMRIPIQYALSYPNRLDSGLKGIDFYKLKELHFQKPDMERFPCLRLAYRAAFQKGTMPAVLNAANEVSVDYFMKKRLRFMDIPRVIEKTIDRHRIKANPELEDILQADAWAKKEANKIIEKEKL